MTQQTENPTMNVNGNDFELVGFKRSNHGGARRMKMPDAELRMRFSRQPKSQGGQVTRDGVTASVAIDMVAAAAVGMAPGTKVVLGRSADGKSLFLAKNDDLGRRLTKGNNQAADRMYITFEQLDPALFSEFFSITDHLNKSVEIEGEFIAENNLILFKK